MAHTLLVADDSATIQRVIELTSVDDDVRVIAASHGDEAIALLERQEPDLVLVDVGMPGRTGYEVARHMRETARLAHIPVLLLTGALDLVDENLARDLGCAGVFTKPFEPQLLLERVRALLSGPTDWSFMTDVAPAPRDVAALLLKDPFANVPGRDSAAPGPDDDIDQYFDRLDAVFANLSIVPAPQSPRKGDTKRVAAQHPTESRNAATQQDPQTPSARSPATLSATSPEAGLSPLADAFAALLAAEQSAPPTGAARTWSQPFLVAIEPDQLVEQIARRVIERLSDRMVRETAAEIIATVAERVVLAEIDRIKSHIRTRSSGVS